MATIITIKRSSGTTSPAELAQGELAYTYGVGTQGNNGDRLFIGTGTETSGVAANIDIIGGKYFTNLTDHVLGTLTASSAILVDTNKAIDELFIGNSASTGGTIKFNEGTNNGSNFVALKAPNNITSDHTITLPAAAGTNGQFLQVDGSGVLSFADVSTNISLADDSSTVITVPSSQTIKFSGGTGLTSTASGSTVTLNLDNTAVSAGSYGSATAIPTFTVDAQGRLTAASTVNISTTLTISDDSSSTASIDLGTDTLRIAGGTGITSSISGDTITLDIDNTVATLTGSQTLTNKTLTSPVISTIVNSGTLTLPTSTDTLVGRATTDTLTNKTLTSPVISTISNSGTLTLPTSTDTLVGRATTDTLTNKSVSLGSNTVTGTLAQFNSAVTDADFASLAGTETLTNKSISLGSNTVTGTLAQFNTAVTDADFVSLAGSETLTNKTLTTPVISTISNTGTLTLPISTDTLVGRATTDTLTNKSIALGSNTVTGTLAQFNSAVTDADFASLAGTETLTNKTLTSPVLGGTTTSASGNIVFKPSTNILEIQGDGSTVGQIQLNCPVNTHGQKIASQPHSEAATNTLTLPGGSTIGNSNATLVSNTGTQTLTNKTLTSPVIATIVNSGTLTLPTSTDTLVGKATTDTLTNKTLTAPKIVDDGFIADANGNELIIFNTIGSAVNQLEFSNSATGNGVTIATSGSDANINLILDPKGSGTVDVNSSRITNVTDPSGDQDAATKAYVDSVANGLDVKKSVRVATATALAAVTYNNGAGTLTANSNGALSIDGVTVSVNDRVLIKDQANAVQNGIYTVTATGSGAAAFVLTRGPDADTASELTGGAFFFAEEGTSNADNGYVTTFDGTPTLGTTNITFSQFSGAGQISAGAALTKTGNTLDVATDNSTIEVSSDALRVKASGIGSNELATDSVTTVKILNANVTNAKLANSVIYFTDESSTQGSVSLGGNIEFLAGEGINTTANGNILTIAGELATASNAGVAFFPTANFTVTSGSVAITKVDGGTF